MFGGIMRVIGIDPGLTRCGLGAVDVDSRRQCTFVDVTVLQTSTSLELGQRLANLHTLLQEQVRTLNPDVIAVERVFSQHNVRTVMGTAQASAVAMLVATELSIPVVMYTPTEVKAATTGSGRASKEQVTTMVRKILHLSDSPKPADAADALAIAICHAWRGTGQERIHSALLKIGGGSR